MKSGFVVFGRDVQVVYEATVSFYGYLKYSVHEKSRRVDRLKRFMDIDPYLTDWTILYDDIDYVYDALKWYRSELIKRKNSVSRRILSLMHSLDMAQRLNDYE